MTDEIKLKPCPFAKCGGEGTRETAHRGQRHWVECSFCNAKTLAFETPEEAAAFWNTRADEPRFRVGDTVTIENMGKQCRPGKVVGKRPEVEVQWPDATIGQYYASDLTKLPPSPPPLPDDHIDRFWIPGAWICHPGQTFVVLDEIEALEIQPGESAYPKHRRERLREWGRGWRFDYRSPIQERREP